MGGHRPSYYLQPANGVPLVGVFGVPDMYSARLPLRLHILFMPPGSIFYSCLRAPYFIIFFPLACISLDIRQSSFTGYSSLYAMIVRLMSVFFIAVCVHFTEGKRMMPVPGLHTVTFFYITKGSIEKCRGAAFVPCPARSTLRAQRKFEKLIHERATALWCTPRHANCTIM